jgi:hypothetical protein
MGVHMKNSLLVLIFTLILFIATGCSNNKKSDDTLLFRGIITGFHNNEDWTNPTTWTEIEVDLSYRIDPDFWLTTVPTKLGNYLGPVGSRIEVYGRRFPSRLGKNESFSEDRHRIVVIDSTGETSEFIYQRDEVVSDYVKVKG